MSTLNKRIIFSLVLVLLSIGIYDIFYSEDKSRETVSLPITSKVIVIDAGHGKPDDGAVGFESTSEQYINLQIAMKLQKIIEQSGAIAVITRIDENGIYSLDSKGIKEKKVSDIKNRVVIGNESDADILISIHLNKFPQTQYRGWQTFYQQENENSKNLANHIQTQLDKNLEYDNSNRVAMPIKNIYLMEKVKIPAITIECGFLSNPEEATELKNEEYQNKLVWGIYAGLQEYFKGVTDGGEKQ